VTAADTTARSGALRGVMWTSGVLAIGCALLAVGHLGLQIPVLSALGPGGVRAVVPAAIAFTVAALLHALVGVGVTRGRSWAWPLGVLIAAATLFGAATPFRGVISAVGIMLAGLELGLLLTRDGRRLLRGPS
jgi:hypothetical protein